MKRRAFIKGAIAVAVSAAIPGSEYTYRTYGTERYYELSEESLETICIEIADPGQRMANALARSMIQTREIVAKNVFNRAFEIEEEVL